MKTSRQIVTAAVVVVLVGCVSNLTARQQFDGRYDNRGGRFDNDRGSRFDDRGPHYDNRGFDRCQRVIPHRAYYTSNPLLYMDPLSAYAAVRLGTVPVQVVRPVTIVRPVPVVIQPQVVYVTNSRCR